VGYGSGVTQVATLGLINATNARDLGGFGTADGRRTRRGRVFRANALNRLTDDDVLALGRLGLVHVVDFRHDEEIKLTGPDRLPDIPACRLVPVPIFDPDHDVFTLVNAALGRRRRSADTSAEAAPLEFPISTDVAMVALYRWFVTSPLAREAFAQVVRLVATAESLPLLFHCTAGKDRTGWLSAVLLTALGVDRDSIRADYLLTNELNAAGNAHIIAQVGARLADPAALAPLLEARLEYLDAAFDQAEDSYGGMDGYVREGLGLDEAVLDALRDNLLE
jgi:protein-tyrosine phosphatase